MISNVAQSVAYTGQLFSRGVGRVGRNLILPAFAFAIAAEAAPASAAVINGTSAAFGESVSVTTTPPVGLAVTATSGPLPSVSGTAPAAYNNMQSAVSAVVTGVLSTGLLNVNAFSNVDGLLGSRLTSATATVNSLAVSILSVLGLTADTVQSFAQVIGGPGSLASMGTTTITNLQLNGTAIVTANVAPDTVLLNVGGVTVTLNEQIMTGNGTTNESLLVNAIDIQLRNVAQPIVGDFLNRSNLLNGSILIGQSSVSMNAVADPAAPVPEPASSVLVVGAILGLGAFRKRRAA